MPSRQNDHEQPADAIAMLKADHQKVRELFQQYEATGDPSAKRNVAEQVFIGARSQGSSPSQTQVMALGVSRSSRLFPWIWFPISGIKHSSV